MVLDFLIRDKIGQEREGDGDIGKQICASPSCVCVTNLSRIRGAFLLGLLVSKVSCKKLENRDHAEIREFAKIERALLGV